MLCIWENISTDQNIHGCYELPKYLVLIHIWLHVS